MCQTEMHKQILDIDKEKIKICVEVDELKWSFRTRSFPEKRKLYHDSLEFQVSSKRFLVELAFSEGKIPMPLLNCKMHVSSWLKWCLWRLLHYHLDCHSLDLWSSVCV